MTIDANLITGFEIGFAVGMSLGAVLAVIISMAIYFKTKKEFHDQIRRDH